MAHGFITIGLELSKLIRGSKTQPYGKTISVRNWALPYTTVVLALRQLRQETCKTEASLDYTERLSVLQVSI